MTKQDAFAIGVQFGFRNWDYPPDTILPADNERRAALYAEFHLGYERGLIMRSTRPIWC